MIHFMEMINMHACFNKNSPHIEVGKFAILSILEKELEDKSYLGKNLLLLFWDRVCSCILYMVLH